MLFLRACAIGLLLPCAPLAARADTPDAYYARHAARRSGDAEHFRVAADFVWEKIVTKAEKRKKGLKKMSDGQKHLICSLSQIRPDELTPVLAARILADRSGVSVRSVLTQKKCPLRRVGEDPVSIPIVRMISVDQKHVPLSKNPVWNACVRNEGLSFDLLQSNADRFEHRRGKVRLTRPWGCRDYHRGNTAFWTMPDVPGVTLVLDRRGKFLGARVSSVVPTVVVPAHQQ